MIFSPQYYKPPLIGQNSSVASYPSHVQQEFQNSQYQNVLSQQNQTQPQYGQNLQNNAWQYNPVPVGYTQQINDMMYRQQGNVPAQNNQNGSGFKWVQGEAGAKAFQVNSGDTVMLMDSEADMFYIKSADQNGMLLPLRVFSYKEITPQQQGATVMQDGNSQQVSNNPVDMQQQNNNISQDYITRSEFEKRIEEVKNAIKSSSNRGEINESVIQSSRSQQQGDAVSNSRKQHAKHNAEVQGI